MNPFLEAAKAYQAMGFHPIPCATREKRPLVAWKDFQQTMPTADQLAGWWNRTPDANVAIVLGRGRFAVDLDGGDDAEQLLANAGISLPSEAPRSKTGGGFHVFLSSPTPVPDRVGLLSVNGGKPQVDIRGVGIVVAPPSIHPNGARYIWLKPLTEHPPAAPPALLELISKASNKPTTDATEHTAGRFWVADALRGVGQGQRDAMCTRLAGFLLKKGLDADTVTAVLCESFAKACDPPFPPLDVHKCVQSIARREAVDGDSARAVLPRHVGGVLDDFERALAAGPAPTLETPFAELNYFLSGGFGQGELIYLGARPGVGKTALGLEFARGAAKRASGSVLVISREMSNLALARRLVAQDARIRATALKRSELTETDLWQLRESLARLRPMPLYLTDEVVSLGEIQAIVEALATEAPLALIVVDYLQLIRAPREIKERRHQVEMVSQSLKTLAMQYRVPVLCMSSLSRPSNEDKNKPPTLASLRESGELEHDADVILLLHRVYKDSETTCYVAKNRDGRLGEVQLTFEQDYVAFTASRAN